MARPERFLCALTGAGPIERLEKRFNDYLDHRHVLAVSSGTAALHTAFLALEIGRGDEVILPGYDWGAATAAALAVGAIPVFADIDPLTYTLDPQAADAACSSRTAGILVTHLFGHPADLGELRRVADSHGVALVEDCAQAWGARYRGAPVGTWGDAAAFSLGWGKPLSTGEGGIVAFSSLAAYERSVRNTQHPLRHTAEGLDPYPFSLNYRMHPVAATLALEQWDAAWTQVEHRRKVAEQITRALAHCSVVLPVHIAPDCLHSFHRYCPSFLPGRSGGVSREAFVRFARNRGVPIAAQVIGRPLFAHPAMNGLSHEVASCNQSLARCATELEISVTEWRNDAALVAQDELAVARVF